MATNLHNVFRNFAWRIGQIQPTSAIEEKRFFEIDPNYVDGHEAHGLQRGFYVQWMGSDGDDDVQDGFTRVANHVVLVTVIYDAALTWPNLHELIAKDRHDLIMKLRAQDNCVGYDDNNPTAEIGLYRRYRVSDTLEADSKEIWTFSQRWRCTVAENEG